MKLFTKVSANGNSRLLFKLATTPQFRREAYAAARILRLRGGPDCLKYQTTSTAFAVLGYVAEVKAGTERGGWRCNGLHLRMA